MKLSSFLSNLESELFKTEVLLTYKKSHATVEQNGVSLQPVHYSAWILESHT